MCLNISDKNSNCDNASIINFVHSIICPIIEQFILLLFVWFSGLKLLGYIFRASDNISLSGLSKHFPQSVITYCLRQLQQFSLKETINLTNHYHGSTGSMIRRFTSSELANNCSEVGNKVTKAELIHQSYADPATCVSSLFHFWKVKSVTQ